MAYGQNAHSGDPLIDRIKLLQDVLTKKVIGTIFEFYLPVLSIYIIVHKT